MHGVHRFAAHRISVERIEHIERAVERSYEQISVLYGGRIEIDRSADRALPEHVEVQIGAEHISCGGSEVKRPGIIDDRCRSRSPCDAFQGRVCSISCRTKKPVSAHRDIRTVFVGSRKR